MANSSIAPPFILPAEGGYVDNPNDKGGSTNRGITWAEWQVVHGNSTKSWSRFMFMSSEDWLSVFDNQYWKTILGDNINSPRIALVIADWLFNSGKYAPIDVQKILDTLFGDHLAVDGKFGNLTISAINSADEPTFYQDLINKRLQFYRAIVANDPSQEEFLHGWENRIVNLQLYCSKLPFK